MQSEKSMLTAARGAVLGFAAAAALASTTSLAHHSPAVFDGKREIVVDGVVTEFHWGQPHSWIHMNVEGKAGAVEDWTIEMDPASHLRRRGWNAKTIKPGDRVSVTVHPLRSGEVGGQYVSVVLPNGKAMDSNYTGPQVQDD